MHAKYGLTLNKLAHCPPIAPETKRPPKNESLKCVLSILPFRFKTVKCQHLALLPPASVKQGRREIKGPLAPRRQNVPQMSWSNICSTVSNSSQRHASRAQRDAQGWTWETKARESIWGSRLGYARTKGQLGNSFGRPAKEEGNLFIIQPERGKKKKGERRASPQKSPTKHTMRPQWRMNYSGSAPARFRGLAHRGKMAVFTYKMFPFWGRLAIQNDNWGLWNPLTYCLRMRARPPQKPVHAVKRVYAHKYFCVFTLAPAISDAPFFFKETQWVRACARVRHFKL